MVLAEIQVDDLIKLKDLEIEFLKIIRPKGTLVDEEDKKLSKPQLRFLYLLKNICIFLLFINFFI